MRETTNVRDHRITRRAAALLLLLALSVQPLLHPAAAQAQTGPGQLIGDHPTQGVALLQWSGGTFEQLEAAAPDAISFWITSSGHLVGYIRGAPAFVNAAFRALYAQDWVPPQPMLVAWPRPLPPPPPRVDCAQARCVALTFDDGPYRYNARLLEILAAHGARATFFVEGIEAEQRPDALRAILAGGHEIGNHAYNHPNLTTLTAEQMRQQINRTADIVEAATGVRPVLLRPPYGAYDARVRDILGMPIVLWSVDPKDYQVRNASIITTRVSDGVRRGSVILLHETEPATIEALPAILAMLKERDLTVVTVTELFGTLEPGRVYTNR